MKLQRRVFGVLCLLPLLGGPVLSAEVHPELKRTSEQYDSDQKGYDDSLAIQKKSAQDGYLAALAAARKMEEGAKRPAGVAAIDAEIAAVKKGAMGEKAPAGFPQHLETYRDRYLTTIKQAAVTIVSAKKNRTESYLTWLNGMEEAGKRGKGEALVAAVLEEKKRVLKLAHWMEPAKK